MCFSVVRLLHLVVRSDIDQTMIHMQKAIAVDVSCVQAYDTIASIEMQRYTGSQHFALHYFVFLLFVFSDLH